MFSGRWPTAARNGNKFAESIVRILIHSYPFFPQVGGIEQTTALLAGEFQRQGHAVRILTATPDAAIRSAWDGIPVFRQPSLREQRRLACWAEVIWQNNLSLRFLAGILGLRRPVIITAQTWPGHSPHRRGGLPFLKRRAYRWHHPVAISRAIAADLGGAPAIIPNPFAPSFVPPPQPANPQHVLFVGRLVSDKGADVLLESFTRLAPKFPEARLSIVGDGPERTSLENLSAQSGFSHRISFKGWQRGDDLARLYQTHGCLVVPSRWAEPFGIVALEGLAAGCLVIGSDRGGLPEAIGPAGLTFPWSDHEALAKTLQDLWENPDRPALLRAEVLPHLARFSLPEIARRYLELFQKTIPMEGL
jgi:glycogen synthase